MVRMVEFVHAKYLSCILYNSDVYDT